MKMMDHIVAHSIQVSRVAIIIVDSLIEAGAKLDRDLVRASALLHDITKTRSLKTEEPHALTGEEFLCGLGYPDVGNIVGQHVRLREYFRTPSHREEEIVNYADKRVLHDRIVSLEERMIYIIQKYGKKRENRQRILWLWNKTESLEKKFFNDIPLTPDDLSGILNGEELSRQLRAYEKACMDA
ncbi:MAG: HD domain-containing protein [Deltaproteobacteria bacterium]|nr:HD domain-containing protein [Deltaproteobacteria bacterium]